MTTTQQVRNVQDAMKVKAMWLSCGAAPDVRFLRVRDDCLRHKTHNNYRRL